MYCPSCATLLSKQDHHCPDCGFDVRPIAQLLDRAAVGAAEQQEAWKKQRQGWGVLLVMSSIIVACFIPVALGLFSGFTWLGSLTLVLSGLIGILLFSGCIVLMAADGQVLVAGKALRVHHNHTTLHTHHNQTTPRALSDQPASAYEYEAPITQRIER